jgi:uncharacterized membrane protein (DUF106 family)
MTEANLLPEKHILENQARLKHIDELMDLAQEKSESTTTSGAREELAELQKDRDKLAGYVDELQKKSSAKLMEKEGPMVMWELVAERLEKLIQRL